MIYSWIVLIVCVLAVIYTYLLYPWWVSVAQKKYSENEIVYKSDRKYPFVAIVMSAFNEESIIEQKIRSVYNTDCPKDKFYCLVGSDASDDSTDGILLSLTNKYPSLIFIRFDERRGKANVLNDLLPQIPAHVDIVIMTDANVLFEKPTMRMLVKHFKNDEIGQVAANVQNYNISKQEIAAEEEMYISRENLLKHGEGKIWGATMGAFGACYAIRKELIPTIPSNFLMEDFFISLHVLKEGYKAILDLDAVVKEDIPGMIDQEFRRKRRISAGNYQNLNYYIRHFISNFYPNGMVFFSHKVLRWLTPFFIIFGSLAAAKLAVGYHIGAWFTYGLVLLLIIIALDYILQKRKIYFKPFRLLRYFVFMNLALLAGFLLYLKGVRTNAWQPTIRKK